MHDSLSNQSGPPLKSVSYDWPHGCGPIALLLATICAACASDIALPEPAKPRSAREERIEPGKMVRLKGSITSGRRYQTFKIANMETFSCHLVAREGYLESGVEPALEIGRLRHFRKPLNQVQFDTTGARSTHRVFLRRHPLWCL